MSLLKSVIKTLASLALSLSLMLTCLTGCGEHRRHETECFFFDTYVYLCIYGGSDEILSDVVRLCAEYDRLFSKTNTESDVWALNNANGEPVIVNEKTAELLTISCEYAELSGGRFDVTCGSVTELWDFSTETPSLPDSSELTEALQYVGIDKMTIEDTTVTLSSGTRIDLGGIAKGFVADEIASYLRENGVNNAVINLGGNVLVVGDKFGRQYTVGVEAPSGDGYLTTLQLSDKSVVTAGISKRGFTLDGCYYHHILDLSTGMPVNNGLASVTVVSESSTQGDALATTLFLMGLEEGLILAESLDGVEAVFAATSGEMFATSGLQ